MTGSVRAIESYLRRHHGAALELVTRGRESASVPIESVCDIVYVLELTGRQSEIAAEGARQFWRHVNQWRLAAGIGVSDSAAPRANVHQTAYALGTLRLLSVAGHSFPSPFLSQARWALEEIVDDTNRPRWPSRFSHHSWRVSHWVGGAASIIMALWALAPEESGKQGVPALADVLDASDSLVDARTGLLKCYKSRFLHWIFNNLYRLRHDPAAGEVAGVVHLHWLNYASGRTPFKSAGRLFERAREISLKEPFVEDAPYCLDFDIVQILRTSAASRSALGKELRQRAVSWIEDIDEFFEDGLNEDYPLHKLPGALAAQHDAALILGLSQFGTSQLRPVDIIRKAGWI